MTTAQEIFDKAVNGLRIQGSQCLDKNGSCVYRDILTDDGKPAPGSRKCAAGHIIEDDEYSTLMEGKGIKWLINGTSSGMSLPVRERLKPHAELIETLQVTHDCYGPERWEEKWQEIASHYNLKYTLPAT